jgi:AhpD family alkylhydroperoxidase
MARVKLYEAPDVDATLEPFYANGFPGPIPASAAQVPELALVAVPFIMRSLGPSESVNARTKEIVILRASAKLQCQYCTQTHTVVALDSGLSTEEVAALRGEASPDAAFTTPQELNLIAWTDAVAQGPRAVPAELQEELANHFTEPQIVELTWTAATTVMLNRYATALDLPVAAPHLEVLASHGWA